MTKRIMTICTLIVVLAGCSANTTNGKSNMNDNTKAVSVTQSERSVTNEADTFPDVAPLLLKMEDGLYVNWGNYVDESEQGTEELTYLGKTDSDLSVSPNEAPSQPFSENFLPDGISADIYKATDNRLIIVYEYEGKEEWIWMEPYK